MIIFLLVPQLCFAQSLESASSLIHTPHELGVWLASEFRYQGEIPDYWQSAEETLNLKTGDCEDFAILAQAVLKNLGTDSDIMVIKFRGLKQTHAICMFKINGFYSFISNRKLIATKQTLIREAVQEKYPDWEKIILTNTKRQYVKIAIRGKIDANQKALCALDNR